MKGRQELVKVRTRGPLREYSCGVAHRSQENTEQVESLKIDVARSNESGDSALQVAIAARPREVTALVGG